MCTKWNSYSAPNFSTICLQNYMMDFLNPTRQISGKGQWSNSRSKKKDNGLI